VRSIQARRREFIAGLGAAAAWPVAARAQQMGKVPIIGYLAALSEAADRPRRAAFVRRLAELGWIEGRTVAIEYRWAESRSERFTEFAAEFARLKVDVIVTAGLGVTAAMRATSVVPIELLREAVPTASSSATRRIGLRSGRFHAAARQISSDLDEERQNPPCTQRETGLHTNKSAVVRLEGGG
jgi:hypothetical protein